MLGCTPSTSEDTRPIGERSAPEQLVALEEALLADPEQALALCSDVTAPNARERCARLRTRPHLWEPRPALQNTLSSPYAQTPPLDAPCTDHAQPRACWSRFAYGQAAAGNMTAAAGACAAIEADRWREECMFQAGEAAAEHRLADGYADAIDLCALSGRFQRDCLSHAVSLLAEHAPETPDGDWQPTIHAAAAITTTWQRHDPQQGSQWREQLWAESLLYAYDRSLHLNGAPLDVLPVDAHIHVRAAVAWRLLTTQDVTSHDLMAWSAILETTLQDRNPATTDPQPRRALTTIPPLQPPSGEDTHNWLGVSRRQVSAQSVNDGLVCLLEAAARQPGSRSLLEAGAQHPDVSVQETAQRLLTVLADQLPVH